MESRLGRVRDERHVPRAPRVHTRARGAATSERSAARRRIVPVAPPRAALRGGALDAGADKPITLYRRPVKRRTHAMGGGGDAPDDVEIAVLAATDPANPYGAALKWPAFAADAASAGQARPSVGGAASA